MRKQPQTSVIIGGLEYPRWVTKHGPNGVEKKVVNNPAEADAFMAGVEYVAPPAEGPSDIRFYTSDALSMIKQVEYHKQKLIEIFNHLDLINRNLLLSNMFTTFDNMYGGINEEYEVINKVDGPCSGLPARKLKKKLKAGE